MCKSCNCNSLKIVDDDMDHVPGKEIPVLRELNYKFINSSESLADSSGKGLHPFDHTVRVMEEYDPEGKKARAISEKIRIGIGVALDEENKTPLNILVEEMEMDDPNFETALLMAAKDHATTSKKTKSVNHELIISDIETEDTKRDVFCTPLGGESLNPQNDVESKKEDGDYISLEE